MNLKSKKEVFNLSRATSLSLDMHNRIIQDSHKFKTCGDIVDFILEIADENGLVVSYDPIVQSDNFGLTIDDLHKTDMDQKIVLNKTLLIDAAFVFEGMHSDITRTYSTHKDGKKLVYDVMRVQKELIQEVREGVTWRQLNDKMDDLLMAVCKQHNEPYVSRHSIGHFVGYGVHERGDYSAPLREGDTITIEPGLYFSNGLGARQEDIVYVERTRGIIL